MLGYKINIKRGNLFEKDYIFTDFVNFLYELKVNSNKNSSDYIISKLLMNSLYGRLGMNPKMENHIIIRTENELEIFNSYIISNVLDLQNGKELISFFESYRNENRKLNIFVPVSAAVTAYGRIHMSQFKFMSNHTLYYTDTDSIDIDTELDSKFVSSELGKMKLEHIFDKAVFLAPKVYGGINSEYEYIKGLKT